MGSLSLIIGSMIAITAYLAMPSVVKTFGRTGHGINSNAELSRLNGEISKLLNSRSLCKRSSLIGFRFDDLAHPELKPVSLSERRLAGVSEPIAFEGWRQNGREIEQLRFVELVPMGPALDGTLYRATLSMRTGVTARAITNRNPNHTFSTKVVLDDDTLTIIDCGKDTSISASCSGHERVTGITAAGDVLCGSANLPDFGSGWIPITAVYPVDPATSGCPCSGALPLGCIAATQGQLPCYIEHNLDRPDLDYSMHFEWMDTAGNIVSNVRRMDLEYNLLVPAQATAALLYNTGFNARTKDTVTVSANGGRTPALVGPPVPWPQIPNFNPPTHVRLRIYLDD